MTMRMTREGRRYMECCMHTVRYHSYSIFFSEFVNMLIVIQ
jgi:hypothetical protein